MNLKQKIQNILLATTLTFTGCAETKPFGKVASYYDTKGQPTATIAGGATDLPLGTKLFGFADVETEKENPDNLQNPYIELQLSKKASNGLGIATEYNRNFSLEKGITRAGFVYEPNLAEILKNTRIGLKFYPTATDNHGMQAGFYGSKSFNKGDITLDTFLDYNIDAKRIVSDLQVGKKLGENFYFVLEGRHNGFKKKDKEGLGIGFEWRW
ncbi:hypothetical protein HYV79_00140 [Candidatus Woesearchaeota archaeon]|nr:hypothetical protein [Candidatus Woesearchaeota archaeon]